VRVLLLHLGPLHDSGLVSYPGSWSLCDLAIPQSLNLYSYVENNPITSTDPGGHFRLEAGARCQGGRGSCEDKSQQQALTEEQVKELMEQAKAAQEAVVQKAKQALDTFNEVLGFGKSDCAKGGDCTNALGMAITAVVVAVASDGASEEAFVEKQIATASKKVENLAARLTSETLEQATREISGGMKILKRGGGEFNHVGKVEQAIKGLDRQARHLERVLKRSGLSEARVKKINGVIERARGLISIAERAITKDPI
jgi:hypothetical protein